MLSDISKKIVEEVWEIGMVVTGISRIVPGASFQR
jgi:hypothetical protein